MGEVWLDAAVAFGLVLRRLRKAAGLTQEKLAEEADLRRTFVSVLELGQQQPTLTTVLKLAKALRCPAGEIISMVEAERTRARRRRV